MKTVNVMQYVSKRGEIQKGKTLTQLAEYVPLGKMLANLTIAGLNASARQAMEFYDTFRSEGDVEIPLLPRHISPDIVDVLNASKFFAQQKQLIEDRVKAAMSKRVEELRLAQQAKQGTSRVSDPEPGAGRSPPATK